MFFSCIIHILCDVARCDLLARLRHQFPSYYLNGDVLSQRAKVHRFIAWLESSRHDANMVDFSLGTSSQASVRQSGVLGSPGRKSCRCDSEGLWVKALTSLSTSSAPCPLLSCSELRMIDETGRVCSSLSCVRFFLFPRRDEMTVVLSRFQSSAPLCEQAVTAA